MILQTIKQLMTAGDKCAQFKALQMMKPVGRLIFYNGAIESGLLELLTTPSTFEQIADTLNIKNRPLLSSLLDLGCVLDELSCKKNHYHIKGAMAKAMTRDTPIADLMRETVHYHADVALRMNSYLKKNKKGDYLKDLGGVIAGSSRIGEPLIKSFINHTIKKSTPLTILECGCGSGEYLKYYVDINRKNSGIAIDKDASAVKIARQSIKKNNIENNFTVLHDDIARPRKIKGASFDLVTSYSNIYYFSDDGRKALFASIHKLLNDNGRFMLATMLKSKKIASAYYDSIFVATEGLYPLPHVDEIARDMRNAGFTRVKVVNLFDSSFKGIVAYK